MLNNCACCGGGLSLPDRLHGLRKRSTRTLAYVTTLGEVCTVRGRWFCARCINLYSQEPDWGQCYVTEPGFLAPDPLLPPFDLDNDVPAGSVRSASLLPELWRIAHPQIDPVGDEGATRSLPNSD